MSYQIFISVRFAEAGPEAELLKHALEKRGITTFLCAVHPGGDIAREIVNALSTCQLAIIMGTRTYGKDTGVGFSTFEELRYIHKKKPFFLIKMCEMFEEPETVFRLGDSVSWFQWLPGRPMPEGLPFKIVEKLALTPPSSINIGSELSEKLPPPPPASAMIATIPLEDLGENEATELLIRLGCSVELRKRLKELNIVIDGGYLTYLTELEILQELEGNNSNLRIPVLKGILNKLKKFQENGIPADVLLEIKRRIDEDRHRIANQKLEDNKKIVGKQQLEENENKIAKQKIEDGEKRTTRQILEDEERIIAKQNLEYEEKRISQQNLEDEKKRTAKQNLANEEMIKMPLTLSGHSYSVKSVMELSDGRLASGSSDNTVKIWNIVTGVCEMTLTGHGDQVYSVFQLSDGRLASGSADKTIKIWNIHSGICELTLSGHSDRIIGWSICIRIGR
jgi:hypothetical protein